MTEEQKIIMSARQGYASRWVSNFDFVRRYGFDPYSDPDAPAVFWGLYTAADLETVMAHRGPAVVRWCGLDAKMQSPQALARLPDNIRHISFNCHLTAELARRGLDAPPLKWSNKPAVARPQRLGNKLYYYALKGRSKYGYATYMQIRHDYPINLITDILTDIETWKSELSERYYGETCLGLALSGFVSGAGGVSEMGCRGIPVITNITDLPNCIPWDSVADIERIMKERMQDAGKDTTALAEETAAAINANTWFYRRNTA